MPSIETPVLAGPRVRLIELEMSHAEELLHAALEDRASYGFTAVPASLVTMTDHIEELLRDRDAGLVVPFTQVDVATHRKVGMTRYLNIRSDRVTRSPYAVEIGGTWLAASAQRSAINTEAKYLLLRHAFEVWGVARVDFKTDSRNDRSRAALTRLGATFEGVLRQWQPSLVLGEEGTFRDSAMFSLVASEWGVTRDRIEQMMATTSMSSSLTIGRTP